MKLVQLAAAVLVLATPASAAHLAVAEGDVLVNRGKGFQAGVPGQELSAGDTVMIGRGGGKATISYDDACDEKVSVGHVVEVARKSPCGAKHQTGGMPSAGSAAAAGSMSASMVVIGAGAAVGLAVAIGSAGGSSSSSEGLPRPSSP